MNIIACKAAGLLQDLQDPDPERIHLVRLHSMCATGKNFIFIFWKCLSPWLFMHKCSLHRKQEWWTTYLNTYNYINGCLLVLKASQTWLVFAGINNRIILGWPVVDSNRQRDHLSPVTYFLDRLQIQIPSIQKVACCIIYILYCSAAWKVDRKNN